jgi:hypothetical protein
MGALWRGQARRVGAVDTPLAEHYYSRQARRRSPEEAAR